MIMMMMVIMMTMMVMIMIMIIPVMIVIILIITLGNIQSSCNILVCYTVLDHDELVGYFMNKFSPNLTYKSLEA